MQVTNIKRLVNILGNLLQLRNLETPSDGVTSVSAESPAAEVNVKGGKTYGMNRPGFAGGHLV